ncbi:hypothetical protein [Herbaspirillum sp. VT-16-41]|uniref:hypothetical protein n=1 Tax=Herbaspirillum sp. VT-16-41 TaxID=1953765 RepID=UPI000981EC58|nr:hypothetical protein [Herbaspirillum sp. VT-16-41]ONN67090.1 hypothetical protein BTM36_07000 [Herbaspirillum sp. VT-16-41]
MIQHITQGSMTLAIIIRTQYQKDGIEFFTPNDFSQQLAYMKRPTGYVIAPHVHNPVKREVQYTKEVLFIKSGKLRVDFYNEAQEYLESTELHAGDVILLAYGGHGFSVIEEAEIIEVKQGPYAGEQDKTRFSPIEQDQIKWIEEQQ